MFNLERWQEIFEAIGKNRLRTFLTGISVASGIFILVILLGVGKGIENGIKKQFERDAAGIIEVSSNVTSKEYKGLNPGRRIQFRNSDYEMSVQKFGSQLDKKAATYNQWNGTIVYGKESGNYQYRGVYPSYQFIENATMNEGRFINNQDMINTAKVGVIGLKMKQDLFKDKNAIGEIVTVNNVNFKIIGVFTDPAGEREETRIYIPLTTMQKTFGAGDKVSTLFYTLKSPEDYDEALAASEKFESELGQMLRAKNAVAPDDEGAIFVNNSMKEAKNAFMINLYIRLFFWWVGICTIVAGVIGVSNIMLIIVKERTKEIGIRKALGASPVSIITMILHESIFITTIAGFIGLLLGLGLLEIVGPQIQSDFFLNPQVNFNVALTTVFILVFCGALAGFFPAYRAAKIKPVVALKDE